MNNFLEGKFKYFTQKELENGQIIPVDLYPNIIPTAMVLDILRERLKEPIYINSTYRDPNYNASVGGAKNSIHMLFNAIDFTVKRDSAVAKMAAISSIYATLKDFDKKGYIYPGSGFKTSIMGLGLYLRGMRSFIHVDTRGLLGKKAPSRWVG